MKIQVQIVQGPAADCSFSIEKNSRCIVGRGDEVDFRITNDELISREHFLIQFDGKQIVLMDLGSTNGTFVDGQALVKNNPVYLNNGQSFVAGRVSQFVVQLVGEPVEPVAPTIMPLPSSNQPKNQPTNFGSSIYITGEDSSEILPSSTPEQTGGNFSQSIVKGIGGGPGLGSEITDPCEQSGLLFANPNPGQGIELGRSEPQSPPGHSAPAPPDHGAGPSGIDPSLDRHGSIAGPGDVDGVGYQFPPLEENPSPSDPPAKSETATPKVRNPAPTEVAQPPSANPNVSPFASIKVNPPVVPPVAISPTASPPVQPTASPMETAPPPLSPPQASSGSISIPGNPQSIEPVPSSGPDVLSSTGSIGLPNQMPLDLPRAPSVLKPSEETAVPPGKIGFSLRRQTNGLFFHSGNDESELVQVLKALQGSFESVFCADLKRAGIEMTPESDPGMDDSKSGPEAGDSNFLGLNAQDESSSAPASDGLKDENNESGVRAKDESTSSVKIGTPLYHWLPSEIRWDHPVLLSSGEFSFDIKEFWQADALVCLFGSSAKQISDHCLELIKIDIRTGKQRDAMFGFCWPSILGCTLESAPEKSVNRIFEGGVAAILLEDPQQETCWNIVSKTDLTELLASAGFVRKNP